jgi:hypothetical protein
MLFIHAASLGSPAADANPLPRIFFRGTRGKYADGFGATRRESGRAKINELAIDVFHRTILIIYRRDLQN